MARQVVLPYKPDPIWRRKLHPGLEAHRFSVIVAHRRFGKTVGTVNHVIKMAIQSRRLMPRYAYLAPYRNQAKQIAWNYLKHFTAPIPGVDKNESELFVELPSRHAPDPGARIHIVGADHPDALRGTYWDGAILDEYAQIKPELWDEVLRPALADRRGWAVFIGTPKGQNQFYEMYQRGWREPDWFSFLCRADESGLFDEGGRYGPDELKSMMRDMGEAAIRQELYCDFTASAYNILIPIDLVMAAVQRVIRPEEVASAPRILGVDVARFGDDACVITRRQGLAAYAPQVYRDISNMDFAALLVQEIDEWRPDAVFVDSGRGEGVIDRCRQLGYEVVEVAFGGRATAAARYVNKRTEMWDAMRKWLQAGGALPDAAELKTELATPEYSFDAANRMKLEPKEDVKERLGRSPDVADALALTFAYPVAPRDGRRRARLARANTTYDFAF